MNEHNMVTWHCEVSCDGYPFIRDGDGELVMGILGLMDSHEDIATGQLMAKAPQMLRLLDSIRDNPEIMALLTTEQLKELRSL